MLGDVTNPAIRDYWLQAIRDGWVIGMLAGPPCETWSRARSVPLEQRSDSSQIRGPRILRDVNHLWGFDSLALKEVRQLCVGNALLGFAILAFLELLVAGGYALIEHSAEPTDDSTAASIWRLPLLRLLLELPNVELVRFCQGLLGAPTPKPTQFLLLNLPQLILSLHQHRVRKENPKGAAIGKTSDGKWRTAGLKEYPPSMCRSIAQSFFTAVSARPSEPTASEPSEAFLARCKDLVQTEYGEQLGQDYAVKP